MIRSDGPIRAIWRAGMAGAIGASLLARTAIAADGADEVAARVLFDEGRKLAAKGDYGSACPKFEESYHLDAGIGAGFNLADCWEHIGRTASAWGRFLGVAAAAKAVGQLERERVARARAAALEPALSRLMVTVSSPAAGLVVTRNAVPLGAGSWGVSVPVDPGSYVIEATAPGKKAFSTAVTVPPAGGDTITVAVAPLETAPAVLPAAAGAAPTGLLQVTAVAAAPVPPPRQRSPLPSLVAGTLGVAALAAGGIFGLEFQSANSDAKKLCPTNSCGQGEKTRHDDLVSEARRDRNLAFAGFAVGGAAMVAAALLWWRPGPLRPATSVSRVSPSLRVLAWGDGIGAKMEGRW